MEINDSAEVETQACGLKPPELIDEQKRQILIDRLVIACDTSRARLQDVELPTLRVMAKYNLPPEERL